MNPIDFGGQRSKVKVTMDLYDKNLVNAIETEPLCASLSNLADINPDPAKRDYRSFLLRAKEGNMFYRYTHLQYL